MKTETEVLDIQTLNVTENSTNPNALIALAIKEGANIESLERLMALQERWQAQQARKVFLMDMSKFQKDCPQIMKNKKVAFNEVKYNYAPLGDIATAIKDALHASGLSYRWEIKDETAGDKVKIKVTCIVSHKDGHSEQTTMEAALDNSGKKNEIQQRGSTITYLRRYTLVGALGISTDDVDVDAKNVKDKVVAEPDTKKSKLILNEIKKQVDSTKTSIEIKNTAKQWVDEGIKDGLTVGDTYELKEYIRTRHDEIKKKNTPAP